MPRSTRSRGPRSGPWPRSEIAPYARPRSTKTSATSILFEADNALAKSGFNAVHIGEEYDGQGADAVGARIAIEEVARVDASASLIPAANKLGTQPIILSARGNLKKLVSCPRSRRARLRRHTRVS